HRRVQNFLLGLRMNHDVIPDLLEQSFPDRALEPWSHLQSHDHTAHHPMVFLQDGGHTHRPLLDDWNQWNQRHAPGNRASDEPPLHSSRSFPSSGHSYTSKEHGAVFVPLTIAR